MNLIVKVRIIISNIFLEKILILWTARHVPTTYFSDMTEDLKTPIRLTLQ